MYAKRRFHIVPAIAWTFRVIPIVTVWAGALTSLHILLELEWLRLPALPVTILATAVSFYLGFKGNAAYERLWEARKIWGGIVNSSRTLGLSVTTMVTDQHVVGEASAPLPEVHRELLYRHIAWLYALRLQLLRLKPWEHNQNWNNMFRRRLGTFDVSDTVLAAQIEALLPAGELQALLAKNNRATHLIHRQGERLTELLHEGRIENFRHMALAKLLEEFYTLQGKAERIKNFPLPRQYATINHWFVIIFITLLPLALLGSFHDVGLPEAYVWLTIPFSVVVGWVFYIWDMVLDYSENPFEGLINDIPMLALSRTIEIDLREMLGETDLPPKIEAVDGVSLM